jgi:hypothetical protein
MRRLGLVVLILLMVSSCSLGTRTLSGTWDGLARGTMTFRPDSTVDAAIETTISETFDVAAPGETRPVGDWLLYRDEKDTAPCVVSVPRPKGTLTLPSGAVSFTPKSAETEESKEKVPNTTVFDTSGCKYFEVTPFSLGESPKAGQGHQTIYRKRISGMLNVTGRYRLVSDRDVEIFVPAGTGGLADDVVVARCEYNDKNDMIVVEDRITRRRWGYQRTAPR